MVKVVRGLEALPPSGPSSCARPRPSSSRGASPNHEPARPRGPPPETPADEPPADAREVSIHGAADAREASTRGVPRTCAATRASSVVTTLQDHFEQCVLEQEEAAARIRESIVPYLDRLMDHGKLVRKDWSRNGAIRCWPGETVDYTDPDTGETYRDAGNYVYACALECALLDAPRATRWWDHEYGEEKAGDMIEIILGLAWMDKGQTPDHLVWRDAVEDLVRKTETLVNITQRTHHRYFAQRVKQALV